MRSDHTLYGILNYTKTPGGARLLRSNILQPPSGEITHLFYVVLFSQGVVTSDIATIRQLTVAFIFSRNYKINVLFTLTEKLVTPLWNITRIFHRCEVRVDKSDRRSQFGMRRLCRVLPNSDPKGWIFLSTANNHERFFFLHTFCSPTRCYTLMSAILKVYVACYVAMT